MISPVTGSPQLTPENLDLSAVSITDELARLTLTPATITYEGRNTFPPSPIEFHFFFSLFTRKQETGHLFWGEIFVEMSIIPGEGSDGKNYPGKKPRAKINEDSLVRNSP